MLGIGAGAIITPPLTVWTMQTIGNDECEIILRERSEQIGRESWTSLL
jgi:hypothetical protein